MEGKRYLTRDDILKSLLASFLGVLGVAMVAIVRKVFGNSEELLKTEARVDMSEDALERLEKNQLTRESVREAIDEALDRRDKAAVERKKEYDRIRLLELKKAMLEVAEKKQKDTREQLERMVPRVVRETLRETRRQEPLREEEEEEGRTGL
jgi:hypothetical protein